MQKQKDPRRFWGEEIAWKVYGAKLHTPVSGSLDFS